MVYFIPSHRKVRSAVSDPNRFIFHVLVIGHSSEMPLKYYESARYF